MYYNLFLIGIWGVIDKEMLHKIPFVPSVNWKLQRRHQLTEAGNEGEVGSQSVKRKDSQRLSVVGKVRLSWWIFCCLFEISTLDDEGCLMFSDYRETPGAGSVHWPRRMIAYLCPVCLFREFHLTYMQRLPKLYIWILSIQDEYQNNLLWMSW